MPRLPNTLSLFLLAGLWLAAGCTGSLGDDDDFTGDDDTGGDDDATTDPRFEALAAAVEAERELLGAPGVAVAVVEGGEVTYAAGFGTRDPGGGEAVEPTTLFRIGSVNKMLTAAAVLQLVEAGAVGLDDAVPDHVPGYDYALNPGYAQQMTVRDTLTHTCGMYDYLEIDSDRDDAALGEAMTGWFVDGIWVMSPPGRMWNYSNPNFYTAGLIVELLSGRWYRERMDEAVFTPLGMDRTFFLPEEVLADGDYATALTYDWTGTTSDSRMAYPDSYDNAWGRPAGYAWSSVLDLARFATFLIHGDEAVLGDALREEMQSPQVNTEVLGDIDHYGYGLVHDRGFWLGASYYDTPLVSHDGAIPGFAASVYMLPELDFAMAVLANADGAYLANSVGVAFDTLAQLPAPAEEPDLTVDPSTFPGLAGTYLDPWNVGELEISVGEGGALVVDAPLLDTYGVSYSPTLSAYTPDNFLWTITGVPQLITFIRDGEGEPEYIRARFAVAGRVHEPDPAVAPAGGLHRPFDRARLERALDQARREPLPRFGWPPLQRPGSTAASASSPTQPAPLPAAPHPSHP